MTKEELESRVETLENLLKKYTYAEMPERKNNTQTSYVCICCGRWKWFGGLHAVDCELAVEMGWRRESE